MPLISVIVPIYNNEKYLKKCVDSIINQSIKSLEIILVNDGSTDGSGKICDSYRERDNRIKVIHQTNCGVSKARNAGLNIACGEYIGFVDSDDYLESDMYELLYSNLKDNDADVSVCGIMNCFFRKNGTINQVRQSQKNGFWVMSGKQAFGEALKSRLFSVNPVNKLFKNSLFNGLRYPEGKTSEDAFLIPDVLLKAKKVVCDSSVKYFYVRRENSITTSGFSGKEWHVVEAYRKHLKTAKEYYSGFEKHAEFRYLWAFTYVLDKMIISNKDILHEDFNKAVHMIRKNALKIFLNPYFSLKRKMITAVLLVSKMIYKKIILKMNLR